MTMHVMDKTWIYSFGGASSSYMNRDATGLEVERLNTEDIGRIRPHTKASDFESEETIGSPMLRWERIYIKCSYLRCCQQGVIPLNTSWANERIGKEGERRFLVFGGVFDDYIS